jgi:zinc protease
MAHLLEHLVFKGSTRHRDIPQELTAHGARPNGTTWYDRTNYFETFAATDENLDWALDLEADRMVHSFIAKKDLDSEMTVVRNEFEIDENDSKQILAERVASTAYLWHNYGKSTIGARSDIENVPIERLQAFYRKWYQPDNAILVVAGNIDETKTLNLIQKKFGAIPRPARRLETTYTEEPVQDGERTVTLRRAGDTKVVSVGYHMPAGSDADYAAAEVLGFLLGDRPSGRLYKALVESKKAATISTDVWQFRDPGLLYVDATLTSEGAIAPARDTMIQTIEAFAATTPTAEEVARARDDLLKRWELTMRDSPRAARRLSEWAGMGDWRLLFLYRDALAAVTSDEVVRVAAAYLKPSNRTEGAFLPTPTPDRAIIPPVRDIASLVKEYKGGDALSAGEAFDPSPEAIEARVARSVLPSGMKLALVSKRTRGATVQALVRLHFGGRSALSGRKRAGELTGDMLLRGTTKHSRQQLLDEFNRLKATVRVNGTADGAWAVIEATRETLPQTLRLAAEVLREPSFPAAELELLRQETIASIEESKTDPRQLAGTAMSRHLTPRAADDPQYTATPGELIEATRKVTLADLKRFHADFYGASAAEASFVGDFDPAEVEGLMSALFGDWKSRKPYARLVTAYESRPSRIESIEAPDKKSAYFMAALRLKMKDSDPDFPALVLGNFMTGGGFLNSRLATRIRRTEGLSYGVRSGAAAGAWDDDARFWATAIYNPENAAKLETAFRDEMKKMLDHGFEPLELAEAKKGWLQRQQVSRSEDRELAADLASRLELGRTLAFDQGFEQAVERVTAEQVLAVMRKHIDMNMMSMIQAGDFAPKAKAESAAK